MTDDMHDAYTSARYRTLGLIANPFVLRSPRTDDSITASLEIHKEADKLLVAVESMMREERTRPIWVDRSTEIHDFFNTAAENVAEQALIRDDDMNVLPLYLQLFMARSGRIRSALHVLAERLATRRFDLTLAKWVYRIAEEETDDTLPAWEALGDQGWQAFLHEFEADSVAALQERFGECVLEREILARPPADVREASLEPEPEESDATAEEDEITSKMPDVSGTVFVPAEGEGEEPVSHEMDAVAAYVVEYTKAHLSPVIARGIRAYVDRGCGQLAQELKITKAPRKTFKKLVEFACLRFGKVAILYDGLDGWNMVPEDLRAKLVAGFTELRLLMGNSGIMIFFVPTGAAPELEEQFGGRDVVRWTFDGLLSLDEDVDRLSDDVVNGWLEAATLAGSEPMTIDDPGFALLRDAADGSLSRFAQLAGAALDAAVDRAAKAVEKVDAEAALAMTGS